MWLTNNRANLSECNFLAKHNHNLYDRYAVFDNLNSPNCITNLMIYFRNIDGYLVIYHTNVDVPLKNVAYVYGFFGLTLEFS